MGVLRIAIGNSDRQAVLAAVFQDVAGGRAQR
jgi:hypothetical protein